MIIISVVWDVRKFECLAVLKGHQGEVKRISFSKDGKFLASGSGDNSIRIWDTNQWFCVATLQVKIQS